ncbi:hypothetical protein [Fusobacterium mortiferum]|uniref:hypothetical protein n=1 Tax=Fusobacterium mortiferum TaxID=850 RepID=UPI000E43C112|nr:hypothetical protein [Fusobacterium mortiferum]RGM99514.1 hypothetical protein DXB84_05430 [Fusobacterium mortiferum]
MENIIVWGGIITMNLLFVFISPILDSLSDNENREKLEKKWLKAFIIILIVSKIITYYINEYEIDSQLIFDFINGNLKFLFNKGENPIISLIEIIVNISQSLEIYLGVISVLVAIYIYLIGLNDDFKKYVLLTLLGEGRPLYLTVFLLILYFFNVSPILFIGLNIVVFYELYNMIKETFKITNNGYFKTNWDKEIINQLLKIRNIKALENMYYEIRKKIMKAILEKDFILLEETIFYYQELLMADSLKEIPEDYILPFEKIDNKKQEDFQENINLPKEFKNSVTNSEQERIERKENYERNTLVIREMKKAVRFLYKIYKLLIKEPDNNLFEEISDVNLVLGKYYLEKQEYSTARAYFDFLKLKYKYLKNNEVYSKEIKELYLFSGLRYYETYYEKLSEEQEIIILKSILNLFNEMVENDDIEDILRYQEIFTRKREEVDMILLKEYTRLLLIFLLEKKGTKSKKETEIKNIINSIENKYLYDSNKLLEKIYIQSAKKEWDRKFDIIDYIYNKPDIFGLSTGSIPVNCTRDIILRLMDKVYYSISDDFIIDNYEELEIKISELKLENLNSRLNELSDSIRMKKAEKISKIQLTEEELTKIYSFVSEENSSFYKFLNFNLKYSFSLIFLSKKSEWEKDFKGYKTIYENRFIKNLINTKSYLINSYINLLNEFWFIECIKTQIKKIENIEEIFKLEKDKYFILSNNSNRRFLNKIGILTHYFSNWNMEKTYIINKKAIKEIIFYLPEGYDRLKYTYVEIESLKDNKDEKILEIIEGETKEEKELIRQGSSILKVAKKMEIVFNDEVEIYEVSNEKLKDEER